MYRYAASAFPITPSDTVDLPGPTTAGVYVGTGGTLTVTFVGQTRSVQLTVPAGLAPIVVSKVWAAGTSATGLSGLINGG